MITFKTGVVLDPPTSTQACILAALAALGTVEVTCGREDHPDADPHTLGLALDVSVAGLSADLIERRLETLRATLGAGFTVLYEVPTVPADPTLRHLATVNVDATAPHFHIQLKKGMTV